MSNLVTITAKFYDKSGQSFGHLDVQSRYQGSSKANTQKADSNGLFVFQASPHRKVELLAKPQNQKDYTVFKTIDSSIVSSAENPVKVQLPKTIEEYKQSKQPSSAKGIVSTFFKVVDSNGKIMKNFPVQSRPKGKGNSPDKFTDDQGIVEVKSSPNRDIEVLVLTSSDQFVLKSSMNSGNGNEEPILIKLDEPYAKFLSRSMIKILDRDGNDYVIEKTNVEMLIVESGRKQLYSISNGKLALQSMVGQKLEFIVYKPDGKPLKPQAYMATRIKNSPAELHLDVNVTKGTTAANDPEINKNIKEKCLCNRDMTLDELKKMISEMRESEGIKNIKIFNHKNCTLEDRSIEALLKSLNNVFKKYEINTCLRKINFMGQIYWEAARFITTTEFASGAYLDPGRHKDAEKNGNVIVGDGARYKGKGFMQLTWRNNYNNYYKYILENREYYKEVIGNLSLKELMDRNNKYNEWIASKNLLAMDSAGWYWLYGTNINLNLQADKNNVGRISVKVNGGANGKKERQEYNSRLLRIMDYNNCVNNISGVGN
ncbi:glycoside hydrolase family 19 [Acinetobacter courvalinii]|uniref:glycoside hydrolase family 19 n=1 Tax=Acinetobacter courvalinii TaxID=280147 RepID=UPI0021CDB4E0|nr:glycoside hydrolase family 19 [Acinetobacter courvalinii]MCU4390731.1 glycoside hydrolase family 19 [Acinetobacter courvalinii]